jgi:23S rRNA pseudouridine2457 synthase
LSRLILFNKPYGVLTQFTPADGHASLKDFIDVPGVYAAGRLDTDSEGLVVLTDDGALQARISHPRHKLEKVYWAQVEGEPDDASLARLAAGVDLGDFVTAPCRVRVMPEPENLWPRDPPIRYRAAKSTRWIEMGLREGKNRQVRRMTAKVGFPTLRLIRWSIGDWTLADLAPGHWRELRHGLHTPVTHSTKKVRGV